MDIADMTLKMFLLNEFDFQEIRASKENPMLASVIKRVNRHLLKVVGGIHELIFLEARASTSVEVVSAMIKRYYLSLGYAFRENMEWHERSCVLSFSSPEGRQRLLSIDLDGSMVIIFTREI